MYLYCDFVHIWFIVQIKIIWMLEKLTFSLLADVHQLSL